MFIYPLCFSTKFQFLALQELCGFRCQCLSWWSGHSPKLGKSCSRKDIPTRFHKMRRQTLSFLQKSSTQEHLEAKILLPVLATPTLPLKMKQKTIRELQFPQFRFLWNTQTKVNQRRKGRLLTGICSATFLFYAFWQCSSFLWWEPMVLCSCCQLLLKKEDATVQQLHWPSLSLVLQKFWPGECLTFSIPRFGDVVLCLFVFPSALNPLAGCQLDFY